MNSHSATILKIYLIVISSISSFQSCKTPSIIVTQEQQKGDYYNNQYDYEQAIVHYRNCLSASAKLGTFRNLDMEADICRKTAHAYSVIGKYDDAISYVIMALNRDSTQNNQLEVIEDYRMLGNMHLFKGDFIKGTPYLEHALDLNEGMETSLKGLNQLSIADTYLSLAQVYATLGRFNQCIEYSHSALDIYRKLNDKKGLMEGQLILGNTYLNLGMIPDGKELIENSLHLAMELELSTARQYQALGEAFTATADFEQAIRYKINALDEAEKSGIIPQIVWSRIGAGDAYADIGDYEKATTYFQSATDIQDTAQMAARALQASVDMRLGNIQVAQQYFREINATVASGLASLKMGDMNRVSGNNEDAIREYNQAIDHFSEADVSEGIAKASLRLADINIDLGNADQADHYLNEAFRNVTSQETEWEIWYQKGRLFEMTQQADEAKDAYRKAVEIIEGIRGKFTIDEYKSTYIENKVKVYDRLIRILLESGDQVSAFAYSERARARAFLDMIGNRKVDVRNTADKELVDQEQELRLRIQALSKMIQKNELGTFRGLSRYQVEDELVQSREEYNSILERIKLSNPEYASIVSIEPTDPELLRRSLDPETALLAYWTGENYLAIWVIGTNGVICRVQQISAGEISKEVTASRQAVRRTSEFRGTGDEERGARTVTSETTERLTAREQLGKVYSHLILPVEGYLDDYHNLGIIPHGSLHFLPFQALINPDGKYLFEEFNLFYTPSASVFLFSKEKRYLPRKHMIAMALGDLDLGDFSGLPGTKIEVDQISKLYSDVTKRYENESTETFLKENISSFEYIHLATHGSLNPVQPLYSYLLFAPTEEDDGLLTVTEVFGLDLNASLVVLSACQTGLGDRSQGDEIIGLSRAFLYAGSPAVIVSLWSVADQPTALLMTSFYRNLNNHSPQDALSMAQREVMKRYPAPFYWAPFQLIGRGD